MQKIFKPTGRGKILRAFVLIMILVLFGASVDAGARYNRSANWLGDKIGVNLPHVWEKDFKLGLDLQGGTHLVYKADVGGVEAKDRSSALEGARDVIEKRVNVFGVSEPVVQTSKSGDDNVIIVELAGVRDVNEAIKMIGETPLLEFKEQGGEIRELTEEEQKELEEFNKLAENRAEEILGKSLSGGDFAALAKEFSEDPGSKDNGGDLDWFGRGIMVPEFETATFDELKTGEIVKDLVKTQFGYHIIKKTDEREIESGVEVRASHILIKTKSAQDIVPPQDEWKNTELTGKNLDKARVDFDPNTGAAEVALEFDSEGTKLFEEITERNVGAPVAIFLDGYPISIPTVNEKITGGRAVISGNFNIEEAKLLARRLNAGALPVPIELISQQTVGASLGKQSVDDSLRAGIIGFILVVLFMIAFYRLSGILAIFSLIFYGVLILALFKLWPVTLTLAGIAGFILSIGMAVDANVLIFERIKEELKSGKPLDLSIEEGFRRAWPSIRDGNVSTLITCFILIQFSTSIVKGFAITLGLGIIISMFSAIVITKNFLNLTGGKWLGGKKWLMGVKK